MRLAAASLAALTLLRFLVAATTPLAPDEAYYWIWSKALAPGYLDHPPMVALWIRIGTAIAGGNPLGVRFLSPLAALAGTWFATRAGRDLLGLDTGQQIATAVLLNATLLVGAGAVTMTPDTPLLLFWTLSLWCFGRALRTGADDWLIAGSAAIGLAFDAKYTGVLLLPAVGAWLLITRGPSATLRSWRVWAAGLVCLLVASPVIVWNALHGFASFAKQGGRAGDIHLASALRFLPELMGGQIGLATPLITILFVVGTVQAVRRGRSGDHGAALVALVTLLPAAVFIEHAFGDRVQANWPSVLYPSAAIAAAGCRPGRWPGWRPSSLLGLLITGLVYVQATLHPFGPPARLDVTTVRLDGWGALARDVAQASRRSRCAVVTDDYALDAELAWNAVPVLGTDRRWRYVRLPEAPLAGCVLLVRSRRHREPPDPLRWRVPALVGTLERGRPGVVVERYDLFRTSPVNTIDAAMLPRHTGLSTHAGL